MNDFIFYVQLGLNHVLDLAAYDHILFLAALALPFTYKSWKKVLLLATIFTIAHCFSLCLSVYELVVINSDLIEFLIPVTILATALFNLNYVKATTAQKGMVLHVLATTFFGLIHGFGFSNYFKMLMAEEENKLGPLSGFATGIEISQVVIVLSVMAITSVFSLIFKVKSSLIILIGSILVILITIPMLVATFPW